MPFIDSKVSVPVSKEQADNVRVKLEEAITIIPGKSKQWLMIGIQDNYDLYFRNDEPSAFIEVKVFGRISDDVAAKMTAEITKIFEEELMISRDYIYIKYEEVDKWGWNGNNF